MNGYAYSFDSDLTFGEMLSRLNALGPWAWAEADSAWYANLARARTATVRLDLLESGGNEVGGRVDAGNGQQFSLSVRPGRDAPTEAEWVALEERVRAQLLPELHARNVQPTDPID